MSKINIAFATDDNYVMPTTVAMTSLFENNTGDIDIYLLSIKGRLSQSGKDILQNIAQNYNHNIIFADVEESRFDGMPVFVHGLSAYLRLFTAELFPHIDKLLYLDADIVVDGSIEALYNSNIDEYQVAGVADQQCLAPDYLDRIGFKHSRQYVNTGVLLMNLAALRKMDLRTMIRSYVDKYFHSMRFCDQEIINCILPDILIVAPKYNAFPLLWNLKSSKRGRIWSADQVIEAALHPVIIHYINSKKPWSLKSAHVHRGKWYEYLAKTCFKDYKPSFKYSQTSVLVKGKIQRIVKSVIYKIVVGRYHRNII